MNVHLTMQVPRSSDLDQVVDHLQQKLEPLLVAFDPGLVQLQGRLVRHTSREGVICNLNLHLPTAQLSTEETATTAQLAVRAAGTELIRQVHRHKGRLRAGRTRPRPLPGPEPEQQRRPAPPLPRSNGGVMSAEAVAQQRADLAGYFGEHYGEVLAFVQRQIEIRERLEELAAGALEAQEVLDEVVVAALSDPETPKSRPEAHDRRHTQPAPSSVSRGRWLRLLAADAIRRLSRAQSGHEHGQEIRPLELDPMATDEPDPEMLLANDEMLAQLARALQALPEGQRHDIVLYLVEGFRTRELAQLTRRTPEDVKASLRGAAATLRTHPDFPERLRPRLRHAALPLGA